MINYGQIDENGYCIGISAITDEILRGNMIKIDEYDDTYLGKKYDIKNKVWTDERLVNEDVTAEPDKVELLGQQLSDLEIQQVEHNIQATQEREFLGQQLSDLEISILERGL